MCVCDIADPPEMYADSFVRARKPHECYECRTTINPREVYRRSTGRWEGEFRVYATCLGCCVLWRTLFAEQREAGMECGCWCFGGLHEEICEMFREQEMCA